MGKEGDTKDKILDLAAELLQLRGYNGFSYTHISQKLGIKNAAVHYHFPTKADLGTAMISRFRELFASWTQHLEHKHKQSPEKLLDGFIAVPRSFMKKENLVCPLGSLESDFNILPKSMQKQTQGLGKDMRDWLTKVLKQGREQEVFHFKGPDADMSLMISAALQGVSFMANAESPALFEVTVTQIKRSLGLGEE